MFEASELLAFVVVVFGLFVVPGPSLLLLLSRAVQGGRKIGVVTGLGIAAGDFIHTLGAVLGLSALLTSSALAFDIVKYLGASYLIYLGIRAFARKATASSIPGVAPVGVSQAFLQALLAEVLNPKTALFFLALLPQFVHPERGAPFMQFAILGLIFVALSSSFTMIVVLLINPLRRLFKRLPWSGNWQGRFIGVVFISLGLKVAAQHH